MVLTQTLVWGVPFAPISEGRGRPSTLDDRWPPDVPIRLCAIRVEFLPDELTGTTGDGSFGSGFPDSLLIDPLPHDRRYFEHHLAFMADYFGTASREHVSFSHLDIYPPENDGAYTLANPMWHYNFNSDTALLNRRLVELFAEAVNAASADVDFNQYDAVLVFHAGVGKDFNVGFDATPFDIPSAYISEHDLARFAVTLPNNVARGLLLPEGQNQEETLNLGVELSLNGVMIKLFGNWLGMPDLYNTETGASGIGRWGMMDQGSGNVNAIVPALPDAWSRVYMGWAEPQVIYPGGLRDTIQVAWFGEPGAPEIVKIPVTDDEYYLLENRNADADSVGHVSVFDSAGREMQIDRDGNFAVEDNFSVAVRASHYDYGIPGTGILIWHINENVITTNYELNRVNADPANRGVELVECDGSQDIGREYGFATAGSGTELGIQEDCWYNDNRAHRDANGGTVFVRFNDDTRPSARLSDNSYSFLSFSDFSEIGPIMSCRVRGSNTQDGFPVAVADTTANWASADLDGDGVKEFYVQSNDSVFQVMDSTGLHFYALLPGGSSLDRSFRRFGLSSDQLMLIGNPADLIRSTEGVVEVLTQPLPFANPVADRSFDCMTEDSVSRLVFTGRCDGDFERISCAFIFDANMTPLSSTSGISTTLSTFANGSTYPTHSLMFWSAGQFTKVSVDDSLTADWATSFADQSSNPTVVIDPTQTLFYLPGRGYFDSENGELICAAGDCLPPQVDWDGDGRPDGGGADGADQTPRENFAAPTHDSLSIHDLNFNGEPDILQSVSIPADSGGIAGWQVTAFDHETHRYPNFPMTIHGQPTLQRMSKNEYRQSIVTKNIVDGKAMFSLMRLPLAANGTVTEYYQTEDNVILVGAPRPQVHAREEFVYAWPNPTSDVARIRLTLPYAADADVTIFDLAGRKIAELRGKSELAGPFEIPWNTVGLQSGVYIGRVVAHGGGTTQNAEIKIAVVR